MDGENVVRPKYQSKIYISDIGIRCVENAVRIGVDTVTCRVVRKCPPFSDGLDEFTEQFSEAESTLHYTSDSCSTVQ